MSRRRKEREPEPGLFDLPLDGPVVEDEAGEPEPAPEPAGRQAAAPANRPWGDDAEPVSPPGLPLAAPPEPEPPPEWEPTAPAAAAPAAPAEEGRGEAVSLSARYLAGLADLAVHVALAVALLFGARLLGVPAGLDDGPALLLFLLIFSFLYTVVPLAFWGQTPGMAWAGLVARTPSGESLAFGQTALRWLGGVLSVLLLGIPVLPAALNGRSLADRLSGSVTLPS